MNKKEFLFPLFIGGLFLVLFVLNFWLFYPGYLTHDWAALMNDFALNNHHPIIYPFLLKKLTNIFGYHLYYPLLFNLIPFYLGGYILTLGCWKKFKSKWCLLGLLPIGIGNIFFSNIIAHSSFSSPMFIFLLWSIVLWQLLLGFTRKNLLGFIFAFVFACISRHNALIQVYPVFFVYGYIIVQKLKPTHQLLKYMGLLFIFSVITITISIGVPLCFKKSDAYAANHIFLHQIAGACVPNHDDTCFKPEWYENGKTYADVEEEYLQNPLYADGMGQKWGKNRPFKYAKLNGLFGAWVSAVGKYPVDYLKHIERYRKNMWYAPTLQWNISLTRKEHALSVTDVAVLEKKYSKNEIFYEVSPLKVAIYDFFRKILPQIPTIIFILLNFILFGLLAFPFFKTKNLFLLYSLSAAIGGIASSIIFYVFSPVTDARYIYPVLISGVISVIGVIIYFSQNSIRKILKYRKSILTILLIVFAFVFIKIIQMCFSVEARIDLSVPYTEKQQFIVYDQDEISLKEQKWMKKFGFRGYLVQQGGTGTNFVIHANDDSNIKLALRGPDVRDKDNKIIENWVDFTSVTINGEEILPRQTAVWHNKPFNYIIEAKAGETYRIVAKWKKHKK